MNDKNRLKNKIMKTKIKNAKRLLKREPNLANLAKLQSVFSKYKKSLYRNKISRDVSRFRLYINRVE